MFQAKENISIRENKIKKFLHDKEPMIAVLLAAANFEWTLCRALLFLSNTPNAELRKKFEAVRGLRDYKELWYEELIDVDGGKRLTDVVMNWSGLLVAFKMRNTLIHGQDRATTNMAAPQVQIMMEAARNINDYCQGLGHDLTLRMPIRRVAKKNFKPLKI